MRPPARRHLAYPGAVIVALLGLAEPAQVDAGDDLALPASWRVSDGRGFRPLSARVLRIVRSPADQGAAVIANVDRP